jgi:hypothetical protein
MDLPALSYENLPGLEDVCLEDSFVREIVETDDYTSLTLLAALTRDHPARHRARPTDAHSYVTATLTFPNVRARVWRARASQRFVDAEGAVDYGNVDRFESDRGAYVLEGEWGTVEIRSDPPELLILHPETHAHDDHRRAYAAWIGGGR